MKNCAIEINGLGQSLARLFRGGVFSLRWAKRHNQERFFAALRMTPLLLLALVLAQPGSAQVSGPITFTAGVPNSNFGRSMAAGDFNGDGFPDILVGAPGSLGEDVSGINPYAAVGRAYIYYGPDFTTFLELNNPTGALTPTAFGWAVAAAEGCTTQDVADAIVSEPLLGESPHLGAVHRYTGDSPEATTTLFNPAPVSDPSILRFGVSLAARKATGAGLSWVAIGTTSVSLPLVTYTGRVYNGPCSLTGVWTFALPPFPCVEPNFGASLAFNEAVFGTNSVIIVGNPYARGAHGALGGGCPLLGGAQGRVHFISPGFGTSIQWFQVDGEGSFGTWVASGTDLYAPRNLLPDTAVGAPFSNKVYLFNGDGVNPFHGGGIHPYTLMESPFYGIVDQELADFGGHFGRSVAIAYLNPDSATQGVVGGAAFTEGEGKVYTFDGSPEFVNVAELALFTPGGGFCAENAFFGWAVAVADFNQDLRPDIAASRPCAGTGELEQQGGVTVFFGCALNDDCATGVCGQGYCRPAPK